MDDDASYSLEEAESGNPEDGSATLGSERVTSAPLPKAPPALPRSGFIRFGPSARARGQRRLLALVLGSLLVASLGLLLEIGNPLNWAWVPWFWLFMGLLGLWRIAAAAARPLRGREVRLGPLGLELRRDDFERLVVFEGLRHLHLVQGPGGRCLSLRLDLDDGSVTLRDIEGLERVFEAAAQGRPTGALIEVEERRVDWEEPLPWILLVLGLGVLLGLVYFLCS
jgi:hypothetical protein